MGFVPFEGGEVARDSAAFGKGFTTFAGGFARQDSLQSPRQAEYRPMGLAQSADGALYIVESTGGRLWRVTYEG